MAKFFASGDDFLAVSLKDTGKLIGLIAIGRRKEQEDQVHNLGYVFHPGYYGQGYATEGCQAVMTFLFEQLGDSSNTYRDPPGEYTLCPLA
jgi:[ribosomal protein S5]-alanine N-acetyltransferase